RREEKRREEKRREEKRREEKRREEKSITLLTNILSFKLLIALLSILLFLISCKSNENPNTPEKPPRKKHELEGTWVGYDKRDTKYENYKLKFTVDSDGNITFSPRPAPYGSDKFISYTYTGKVKTNSITYPYDAKVLCKGTDGGTFTFSNSSNCTAKYDRIDFYYENGYMNLSGTTVEFTKQ
uniref:hypothetical protein n=1 Tax=uncultured Brachyspira sp. TaxID=221953 RepID=UPI00259A96D6